MNQELKDELQRLLKKGRRSLQAAQDLFDKGHFDFAVSRAYYAMFYHATAALLVKGHTFSKHSGVIAGFGRYLAKTGEVPNNLHRLLQEAFERRNIGDYGTDQEVSSEDSSRALSDAERFLQEIERHLGLNNADDPVDGA